MLCIPLSLFFFSKLLSISTYTHHILDSDFVHITPEISDILSKLTYPLGSFHLSLFHFSLFFSSSRNP